MVDTIKRTGWHLNEWRWSVSSSMGRGRVRCQFTWCKWFGPYQSIQEIISDVSDSQRVKMVCIVERKSKTSHQTYIYTSETWACYVVRYLSQSWPRASITVKDECSKTANVWHWSMPTQCSISSNKSWAREVSYAPTLLARSQLPLLLKRAPCRGRVELRWGRGYFPRWWGSLQGACSFGCDVS